MENSKETSPRSQDFKFKNPRVKSSGPRLLAKQPLQTTGVFNTNIPVFLNTTM
jgi:hypothetical protein